MSTLTVQPSAPIVAPLLADWLLDLLPLADHSASARCCYVGGHGAESVQHPPSTLPLGPALGVELYQHALAPWMRSDQRRTQRPAAHSASSLWATGICGMCNVEIICGARAPQPGRSEQGAPWLQQQKVVPMQGEVYHQSVTLTVTDHIFNPTLSAAGRVLQVLASCAPIGTLIESVNRDLAATAQCSPGGIPAALRYLEKKGWIERVTTSRGSLIVVTE